MYKPLYAEKQCLICGDWRGQHTPAPGHGGSLDQMMFCNVDPVITDYYGLKPRFVSC